MRFHDLRQRPEVNIEAISRRLGHSSIQVTGDIYLRVYPEQERQIAELFEALPEEREQMGSN